ncbi:TPA: restriction endonuclease subunit S [Pseudomonas putida]|nr:restriction endonuclease subunit S [Pseudomonas putida]
MTALLIENLPLLAGAPNGIKKLRELILELAIRGKLVPQDSNDEPASELLKRIAENKARLVAEGKIKKQKDLTDAPVPVISFPLPVGWAATSIGEATICRDGERVPVSQAEREGRDKVFDYYGASGVIDKIDGYLFDKSLLLVGEDGANLINRSTPIAFMARGRYWVNNHAHVLDGINEELLLYIELYFNAIDLKPYVTGTAQPKMNQSKMNGIPVALPPVAEQHRIVAKVDELMDLCNRLEAQQADAESAHSQLVQTLLDSLTQASDASDFAVAWQRLAEHFHTLLTTEPSIDALKQTLLQLAVMGKLVYPDSSDEPASELLKRIAVEKRQLMGEGKIKKQKLLGEITEEEKTYELPAAWAWTRLGSQVIESGAGWSPSCEARPRNGDEWGVLKVSAVSWGIYRPEENKALPPNLEARPEHEVTNGDFLVSRANTAELVARSVVVEETPNRLMLSDKIVRLRLTALCARRYINLANSAPLARSYYSQVAGGTSSSMKNVSREQILNLPIALPPLAEQQRIVDKVDQLMLLCDTLKRQINVANEKQTTLLNAVIAQV